MLTYQDTTTSSHPIPGPSCRTSVPSSYYLEEPRAAVCPYQDLCVIKMLNKAKFPVYLACSKVNKKHYAMKVFPLDGDKPHRYFKNEIRFARLDHENVIKIVYLEFEKETFYKGGLRQVSFTLMEYAPYGDFYDLVNNSNLSRDTKLIRTYFRQLIKGLEYLHSQGVAHMDIKLENLLLGEDYTMKIADFDLSYIAGDKQTLARGTKCYRAPEVMRARCVNYSAADIYSAGVVLFIMKSGGIMPHSENTLVQGLNFYELLYANNERFWRKHTQISEKNGVVFEPEFRELFNAMTKHKPEERATIKEIKNSKWYNGEVYTPEEFKKVMNGYLQY